ncbi:MULTISPECIES: efflux RND transporter periplasmic adaptor subunit [Thalassolituus]|jgi:RND family efflux transporter MFP subunit|uniref:efflux RND transporter periplasmic adaptor subunit n=1 Tax=Thalassolituus TaxID=187492 RepID=UPI00042DC615|nr:efflux RND transporter periplasmic adaptor subunit [Thalassolituus oleivorans]AHK17646.1 hypothetical protein R615_10770 [Thalassolituus oleivorans R6-15]PCI47867.1 MAG: HlyD family secretion protein [Oceanospirillales bacterium]PHQ87359.1 MAG: HlyD family secretion protein [Thalassobium sp.]
MSRTAQLLITIAILAGGVSATMWIKNSNPKPERKAPEVVARLVEARELERETTRPTWPAGGTVNASDEVSLAAQVSARVEWISPEAIPGARLSKGTLLARLESADFDFAVKQKQAALAQVEADLAVEQGQADLAAEEFQLSAAKLSASDRALVMREPQLAAARAAVASAKAAVEQAKLDLARTEIRMPFDGQIMSRKVSPGSQVGSASTLFDLVATDTFWIEVKMPRAFLPWLDNQHAVTLSQQHWAGKTRQARILNVLPDVDSADRQVKVVLALDNPLSSPDSDVPPVLLNDYIDCVLYGREIIDAIVMDRRRLNDDDSTWAVNTSKLVKRQLDVIYRGRERVWIKSGFEAGDQLLMSQLDTPVIGLPLRVQARGDKP